MDKQNTHQNGKTGDGLFIGLGVSFSILGGWGNMLDTYDQARQGVTVVVLKCIPCITWPNISFLRWNRVEKYLLPEF